MRSGYRILRLSQAALLASAMAGMVGARASSSPPVLAKPAKLAKLAAAPAAGATATKPLIERLGELREKVLSIESGLLDGMKASTSARANIQKIQQLLKFQQEERVLGRKRMQEIEDTIHELEVRRTTLRERVTTQQRAIRRFLAEVDRASDDRPLDLEFHAREREEAPRRRLLRNLADRGLREIEELRIDLADADELELKIQEEKGQLVYLFQDLQEQSSILELNRQLQLAILQKRHAEKAAQLESYRRLKSAQGQVESLIKNFNARKELQDAVENERVASRAMMEGAFAKLKGTLPMPAAGRLVSLFGKGYDEKSKLQIFKKGVEIDAGAARPVAAISSGKIAYSGELPNYGRVAIVDHGNHFYSLCAHLGELRKQAGDAVVPGDVIGLTDPQGTPLYFEIRARNIAVNPLQWVVN